MTGKIFTILLGVILVVAMTGSALGQTRTPWQMHRGLESGPFAYPYDDLVTWGYTMPSHGNVAEYNYSAEIPGAYDAGWGPAPNGDTINFSIYSRLCGKIGCRQGGDFTYFQSFVNIPENVVVNTFTIAFSGMDDGSRITVINSTYPDGLVIPGSYVFLGGTGTSNLAPYVVSGELNRVIITQVDDCCSGNNLRSASVVLNGTTVITNPDSDGDGVPDQEDTCPGFDDNLDADNDGIADGCDLCPLDADNDADDDGLCADEDLCPLDADNDIDGDGLCGNEDLCPLDADNDLDGDGLCGNVDPCPLDVGNDGDGDGLCESEDNCPLDANVDQADFDADGSGDVCDEDSDGDGVIDVEDLCLYTPAGELVLPDGCSLDQTCVCEAQWKNHGAYVSCVAHACNVLVAEGLITGEEHGFIVSEAGRSTCGKKK